MPSFALFDLDNTLLIGDSDKTWGHFLVENNMVEKESFARKNEQYYQDYVDGTLDIHEYHQFSLEPFTKYSIEIMEALRVRFIEEKIQQMIPQKARQLVEHHQALGDTCVIITATQSFVTRPIAALFKVEHLLATEPEIVNNAFTGKIAGTPCFQDGKITRFREWLIQQGLEFSRIQHITSYSDSYNDMPLLKLAHTAITVNPDTRLEAHAREHHWKIIITDPALEN